MKKGIIIALVAVIAAGGITTAVVLNKKADNTLQATEATVSENDSTAAASTDANPVSNKDYLDFSDLYNKSFDELCKMAEKCGYKKDYYEFNNHYAFIKQLEDRQVGFGVDITPDSSEINGLTITVPMEDYKSAEKYFSRYDIFTDTYSINYNDESVIYSHYFGLLQYNGYDALLSSDVHFGEYDPFGSDVITISVLTTKYYELNNMKYKTPEDNFNYYKSVYKQNEKDRIDL